MSDIAIKKLNLKALGSQKLQSEEYEKKQDQDMTQQKETQSEKKEVPETKKAEKTQNTEYIQGENNSQKNETGDAQKSEIDSLTTPAVKISLHTIKKQAAETETQSEKKEVPETEKTQNTEYIKGENNSQKSGTGDAAENKKKIPSPQIQNIIESESKQNSKQGDITEKKNIEKIPKNGAVGENTTSSLEQKKQEDTDKVEFQNYTSNFEKKSKHILNHVRKFRYSPKTHVGFLVSITLFTFGIIVFLMVFFPEKHNFENYKASVFNITNMQEEKDITPKKDTPIIAQTQQDIVETEMSEEQEIDDYQENIPQGQEESNNSELIKNILQEKRPKTEKDLLKDFLQHKYLQQ